LAPEAQGLLGHIQHPCHHALVQALIHKAHRLPPNLFLRILTQRPCIYFLHPFMLSILLIMSMY
jgi:hypothetical protein